MGSPAFLAPKDCGRRGDWRSKADAMEMATSGARLGMKGDGHML